MIPPGRKPRCGPRCSCKISPCRIRLSAASPCPSSSMRRIDTPSRRRISHLGGKLPPVLSATLQPARRLRPRPPPSMRGMADPLPGATRAFLRAAVDFAARRYACLYPPDPAAGWMVRRPGALHAGGRAVPADRQRGGETAPCRGIASRRKPAEKKEDPMLKMLLGNAAQAGRWRKARTSSPARISAPRSPREAGWCSCPPCGHAPTSPACSPGAWPPRPPASSSRVAEPQPAACARRRRGGNDRDRAAHRQHHRAGRGPARQSARCRHPGQPGGAARSCRESAAAAGRCRRG